jgi:pyruvate kinase
MILTTLPPIHHKDVLLNMLQDDRIGVVRYNTACKSPYSPSSTIEIINDLCVKNHKLLYIDLKGRQLRITKWAVPTYGDIVLNHNIKVDLPAKIYFRGDAPSCTITNIVDGNRIFVTPDPPFALGEGQAVNIIGNNLQIEGYLTDSDIEYINACNKLNIKNFMLSFVEKWEDVLKVKQLSPESNLILKIESKLGLDFVSTISEYLLRYSNCCLMAARDDLFINSLDKYHAFLSYLQLIVMTDPDAMVASRLLTSLDSGETPSVSDLSDIELMKRMGYKCFMLSDGISTRHFSHAVTILNKMGIT